VSKVARIGSANMITLARIVLIPVFLVFLLGRMPNWGPWIAAVVFTLLGITDAVDGYVARTRNEVTTFGKFIDPLADKLLVTAALVALVDLGTLPAWIAIVIISRELIVSGLRMVAVAEGKIITASGWGKVKTVMQIIAIVVFIVKDNVLLPRVVGDFGAIFVRGAAWPIMAVALALTIYSAAVYFYHARDVIAGPWSGGDTP
jgi:nicotinamide-nucleotide amidase